MKQNEIWHKPQTRQRKEIQNENKKHQKAQSKTNQKKTNNKYTTH